MIYTDNEAYFNEKLQHITNDVVYCLVDPSCNPYPNIYMLKIGIVKDFKRNHNQSFMLLDSDTYFTKSPDELFQEINEKNHIVMCTKENTIKEKMDRILNNKFSGTSQAENHHYQLYKDIYDNKTFCTKSHEYNFIHEMPLWNSGVIGMRGDVPVAIIEEIESLAEMLYQTYQYRVSEQFAFSYIHEQNFTVYTAGSCVFHYWFFKDALKTVEQYFSANTGSYLVAKNEVSAYDKLSLIILARFFAGNEQHIVNDILLDHPTDSLIYQSLKNTVLLQNIIKENRVT